MSTLTLIVSMWINSDVAAFEAFEMKAAAVMAAHGGVIDLVIRTDKHLSGPAAPFEIHVISFPDRAAFERYRQDPASRALAGEREAVIKRSTVTMGYEGLGYPVAPPPPVISED